MGQGVWPASLQLDPALESTGGTLGGGAVGGNARLAASPRRGAGGSVHTTALPSTTDRGGRTGNIPPHLCPLQGNEVGLGVGVGAHV